MGQTSGGNSGGLELLERVSATEEQIEGIVTPRIISFTPTADGFNTLYIKMNDSVLAFGQIVYTGQPITTTIDVSGNTRYVYGKIENANPCRLNASQYIGANAFGLITKSNGVDFKGLDGVQLYYDGTNTYLLGFVPLNKGDGNQFVVCPFETVFFNSQLKN